MTTATALRPCPFCGSQFVMSGRDFESYPAPNYYIAFCSSCDAIGPAKDTSEQAIAAWNARSGGDEAVRLSVLEAAYKVLDINDHNASCTEVMLDGVLTNGLDVMNRLKEVIAALRTHGASHE